MLLISDIHILKATVFVIIFNVNEINSSFCYIFA